MYSLCLLDGRRHGQEDAVDADGEHDHVVKVLVRAQVHADDANLYSMHRSVLRIRIFFPSFHYSSVQPFILRLDSLSYVPCSKGRI